MKLYPVLILTALAITGCTDAQRSTPVATQNEQRTGTEVDHDNTAVNDRDRDSAAKTPIDQNENQADINVTADIRKRVVDTKMSVNAQNVKIITQNGQVTLRGPVKTADEKKQIEDIAHEVAGADKVVSQLEVEHNP